MYAIQEITTFLFAYNVLYVATIIGFDADSYVTLESDKGVHVCLAVLNNLFQSRDSIDLIILTSNKSAGMCRMCVVSGIISFYNLAAVEEDYTNCDVFHEFNTSSQHYCFNIEVIDDNEVEQTEDFYLTVHVISSSFPVHIDPGRSNGSVTIVDDDGIKL